MFLSTEKCNGTGKCVEICPTDAIEIVDGKAFSCITCGKCEESCPNNAIFKNQYGGYVVDKAKCNLCGMCQLNCPVNIIKIDTEVRGICSRCGVCVDACPNDARVDGKEVDEKQKELLESLNVSIPEDDVEPPKKKMVNRVSIGTVHENCINCGRCAYFCPSNAIKFSYIEQGVCTECDTCVDVCPRDAIGPDEENDGKYKVDMGKCAICYKCMIACPNDAITAENFELEIHHPDYNIREDTEMIACLACGMCVEACPHEGLKLMSKRIRFDANACQHCPDEPCVNACPQDILQFVPESKIELEGICVSCGGCVKACNYDARKYQPAIWKGEIGEDCIKCGLCVEVCQKNALTFNRGDIQVNFDECIMCEECGIYCPVNALPKTTPLNKDIVGGFAILNQNLCMQCGLCAQACNFESLIKNENGEYTINNDTCTFCGACKNICPASAISIEREFEASI
ncbi:MAG: 4Fe-4S binding protein [Methanobacteriaceae archaeon]|nr:4Fe-4S binding protein [Methanobacteriaceae archaeon]